VDHISRRELAGTSHHRLAGRQAADALNNSPALFQNSRASRAMNRSIHAASAQQRGVGGIHDRVGFLARDVTRSGDNQRPLANRNAKHFRTAAHSHPAETASAHFAHRIANLNVRKKVARAVQFRASDIQLRAILT
jgi:hypothetical protein